MELAEILGNIISAIALIAVAVIETRASKERKSVEKRAARRAKESRLSMDMMYAACGLAMDTGTALRDGHTNGTLEGDLQKAREAMHNYDSFIKDEAAHAVAKT